MATQGQFISQAEAIAVAQNAILTALTNLIPTQPGTPLPSFKTINNQTLIGVGNISIAAGGSVDFLNTAVGAAARTITSRLSQEIWVEDFRQTGDTDADVWDKAITAMQILGQPLHVGRKKYSFNRSIIVTGQYFKIIGTEGDYQSGTVIENNISGFAKISGNVNIDITIPTNSNPGPMRGCAFYFTSLIYYSSIQSISFSGFRFALAFLQSHNSPVFNKCYFYNCNVGLIAYQGCQNYQYLNCNSAGVDVVHISSATCFPQGSTYSNQDNYYTDSLYIKNEGGYGSFGGSPINNFFDDFFVKSFLRPNDLSYSVAATVKYTDANNNVYTESSKYARPSGRIFFVPMRNGRIANGWHFKDIDIRGILPRGFGLVNNAVTSLMIEGSFLYEPFIGTPGQIADEVITVGSIVSAMDLCRYEYNPAFGVPRGPMFGFTGKAAQQGLSYADYSYVIDINSLVKRVFKQSYSDVLYFQYNTISEKVMNNDVAIKVLYPEDCVVGMKHTLVVTANGYSNFLIQNNLVLVQGVFNKTNNIKNVIEVEWLGTFGTVKIFPVII